MEGSDLTTVVEEGETPVVDHTCGYDYDDAGRLEVITDAGSVPRIVKINWWLV